VCGRLMISDIKKSVAQFLTKKRQEDRKIVNFDSESHLSNKSTEPEESVISL